MKNSVKNIITRFTAFLFLMNLMNQSYFVLAENDENGEETEDFNIDHSEEEYNADEAEYPEGSGDFQLNVQEDVDHEPYLEEELEEIKDEEFLIVNDNTYESEETAEQIIPENQNISDSVSVNFEPDHEGWNADQDKYAIKNENDQYCWISGMLKEIYEESEDTTYLYYFDENGIIVKETEIQINDSFYYFDENGHALKNQWNPDNSKYYSFDGTRISGAQKIGSFWYYFNPENDDCKTIGFYYFSGLKGNVYYDEAGHLLFGFQNIDGNEYHFETNGIMTTGTKKINGKYYNFDSKSGIMFKNTFFDINNNYRVYYDENGWLVFGTRKIGGYWYNFSSGNGNMIRNQFVNINNNYRVYYDSQGHLSFGSLRVGSYYYFFDQKNGAMVSNSFIDISPTYRVFYNSEGHLVFGYQFIDGSLYYFQKSNGALEKGEFSIDHIVHITDSKGVITYTNIKSLPYYSQTNPKWSWYKIGNAGTIAQNGCGPAIGTSIINFYKNKGFTPIDTAKLFYSWGHYNSKYGHGTDTGVWRVLANYYGLYYKNNLSLSQIKQELRKGNIVTAAVGRGTFVNGSYTHFILMYGFEGNRCWVYDPLNSGRNGKYSVDSIYSQRSHIYVDNLDGGPFIALGKK